MKLIGYWEVNREKWSLGVEFDAHWHVAWVKCVIHVGLLLGPLTLGVGFHWLEARR